MANAIKVRVAAWGWAAVDALGWVLQHIVGLYALLLQFLVRRYVHHFVKVSHRAKCPGCGSTKRHEFRWSPVHQSLIHQCAECKAEYPMPAVVPASKWLIEREPQSINDEQERTPWAGASVSREPKIVKVVEGKAA